MEKKRTLIVKAALTAFLESGYAESSMNRIADAAGVSIKTVYRHFDDKDDLFNAVMRMACETSGEAGATVDSDFPWFDLPPREGFCAAGEFYLKHTLGTDQVDLFRVAVRDARKFPELGRRYVEEVIGKRNSTFVHYLEKWKKKERWRLTDPEAAANAFAGLLRAGIYDDLLLGIRRPNEREIAGHAAQAAVAMLTLLQKGLF